MELHPEAGIEFSSIVEKEKADCEMRYGKKHPRSYVQ